MTENITLSQLAASAADEIVAHMHKGQAFSIKTISGWLDYKYNHLGRRGFMLLVRAAIETAKNDGRIVRQDGKYAPGVAEGWKLA